MLKKKSLSSKDQALFLKGLQDHPEWVNQPGRTLTSLIIASQHECLDIAKALIQAGSSLNAQNHYGLTALISASFHGHLEVVNTLIDAGADLNLQDQWGGPL